MMRFLTDRGPAPANPASVDAIGRNSAGNSSSSSPFGRLTAQLLRLRASDSARKAVSTTDGEVGTTVSPGRVSRAVLVGLFVFVKPGRIAYSYEVRPSRTASAGLIVVAVVVGVLAVAAPLAGVQRSGQERATDAASKIEDRGWGTGTFDGRSIDAAPALGLSGVLASLDGLRRATLVARYGLASEGFEPVVTGPSGAAISASSALGVVMPSGESAVDARSGEGLEAISYPWREQLRGWTISFLPANNGLRGLTFSAPRSIEVYVRGGDTAWDIARVLAHEIGHAVDLTHNDFDDRERWRWRRGVAVWVPWWPEPDQSDFATGAGDFAECFAGWQVASASLSEVGGHCSEADLVLVAELSSWG
jgi:hypothetical protein